MTDREKLIALLKENTIPEYWAEMIADHLIANGVVVREKGEWILNRNGSATCKKCLHTTLDAWGVDEWLNFCPKCGADMRAEEQNRAREGGNDG